MKRYCLFAAGLFLFPLAVSANLRVSEIAWMGTKDSSSHEWIELFNDGADASSVDGWKLESGSGSFSISLKGSVDAKGYYLIKRTSDFSDVNAPADLVASFGSGLKNTGDTLRLIDAAGGAQDEVIGGSDWKNIGGNNDTKETAQWTQSGWMTAAATPHAAASQYSAPTAANEGSSSLDSNSSSGPGGSNDVVSGDSASNKDSSTPAVKNLPTKIMILGSGDVVARSDSVFSLSVSGTDQRYDAASVVWNFGDGTTAKGQTVTHRYLASGGAVVVASVIVGGQEFVSQKNIAVRDVNISITSIQDGVDGFVRLSSKQNIDIGSWTLRDGTQSFLFPGHTVLAGGSSTAIPNSTTGMFTHTTPALFDASGRLVFAYGDREGALLRDTSDALPAYIRTSARGNNNISSVESGRAKVEEKVATMTLRDTLSDPRSHIASGAYAGGLGRSKAWPYWLALTGIISVSCAVAYYASRRLDSTQVADDEAAKYAIIEIDSNLHDAK